MANRNFQKFVYSLEQGIVGLYASVAVGATGAPTLSTTRSKGVASIARNSAGKYTLTLQDRYQYLMLLNHSIVATSGAPATGSNVNCIVRADNSGAAAQTVVIEFVDATGAAIELANGATVLLKLTLKNSTV